MPYDWSNPYNSYIPYDVGNPQSISVTGIVSASALGVDLISIGSVSVIISGVSSGMAIGFVNVSSPANYTLTGITSSEQFSIVITQSPATISVHGISSSESFGFITVSSSLAPNPRFVRGTFNDQLTVSSTTNSVTIYNQAGDSNIICLAYQPSTSLVSLFDSNNNTYSLIAGPITNNSWHYTFAMYMSTSIAGGINTITSTFSAASTFLEIIVAEYYGTGGVDGSPNGSIGSGNPTSGPVTTTGSSDILLCYGGSSTDPGPLLDAGILVPGVNFTPRVITSDTTGLEDRLVTPGTYTGTWSINGPSPDCMALAVALFPGPISPPPPSDMSRVL